MTRKFIAVLASLLVTAVASAPAAGQGFGVGSMDIGPTIGLGGIGSASIAIGGRFEKAIKVLPSMGDGILGIQASVDYYSWGVVGYDYKYIPFGVTANYHFQLEDKKIDPFVGLGLGYSVRSCDYSGTGFDACPNSAIYFIGRAGARYYFSDNMAAYADVGAGAATINVGIMFKMK